MKKPIKITKAEADEIIKEVDKGKYAIAVACYKGQWYDVRGYSVQDQKDLLKQIANQETQIVEVDMHPLVSHGKTPEIKNVRRPNNG